MQRDPASNPHVPYRPATALARWVTYTFAFYAMTCVARLWFYVSEHGVIEALVDQGRFDSVAMAAFEARAQSHQLIAQGLGLPMVVLWCMWTYRVATNAHRFGVPMRTTPGWAVGWHFIPIANLWKPYTALREVWHASSPEPVDDGRRPSTPHFFLAWWLVYVACLFVESGAESYFHSTDPHSWLEGMRWYIAAIQIDLVGCGLAVLVCWRLTRRQEARALGQVPRAEVRRS